MTEQEFKFMHPDVILLVFGPHEDHWLIDCRRADGRPIAVFRRRNLAQALWDLHVICDHPTTLKPPAAANMGWAREINYGTIEDLDAPGESNGSGLEDDTDG